MDKIKKICFISPKSYSLFKKEDKNIYGGAEVQLYNLGNSLAENKVFEVHFMVADYGQDEIEKFNNVYVWKAINFKNNLFVQIINFYKIFKKIKADIYIQRTLTYYSGIIALYCKVKKIKFYYMLAHDNEANGENKIYKNILGRMLIRMLSMYSTKIIAQNQYEKKNFIKLNYCKNITILKKGLKLLNFFKTEKTYDCVWVGRCVEWKNPEIILKLAKMNIDLKFLMICPEATKKNKYFNKVRKTANSIKNIKFIDLINHDEVIKKISQSKIFCLTSDLEGDLPSVVIESCSVGVPIISYKINNQLFEKYNGGIYCNNNLKYLNNSLNKLIGDKILYKRFSIGSYIYAKKFHNIEKILDNFIGIINS